MRSSSLHVSSRRRAFIRLLSEIKHALNQSLLEEFHVRKLTQQQIAKLLGVDKSFVSKKLSGEGNMTLETLADLAYALDRPIKISMPSRQSESKSNFYQSVPSTSAIPSTTHMLAPITKSQSPNARAAVTASMA